MQVFSWLVFLSGFDPGSVLHFVFLSGGGIQTEHGIPKGARKACLTHVILAVHVTEPLGVGNQTMSEC